MSRGADTFARVLARRYDSWATSAYFVSYGGAQIGCFKVMDHTRGVEIGTGINGTLTVAPAISIRAAELEEARISASDLLDATVTVNGDEWKVSRSEPKPGPFGSASGEVYLILVEQDQ